MKDCNSCGKCCIKYGNGGLSASDADIEGWALFNPELFEYVRDGNIWFDPKSNKQIEYCPWLKKQTPEGTGAKPFYTCDIYHNRPEDCRHYPSTIEEMIGDECEMIEVRDLPVPEDSPRRAQQILDKAQRALDKLMADSRPPRR
jgi:Fe-S-cluster containining protein